MKLRDEGYMTSRWWLETMRRLEISHDTATGSNDSGEVKFVVHVMDDGGLRVAPHGCLTIRHSGDRDPNWRRRAEHKYGVLCRPVSALVGQLVCPITKKVIPASRFDENYIAWVDKEFGIAVVSYQVKYEVPDGPPLPFSGTQHTKAPKFKYSFANHKRYETERERVETLIAEAKLRVSLRDEPVTPAHTRDYKRGLLDSMLKRPEVTDMHGFAQAYTGLADADERWISNLNALSTGVAALDLSERASWNNSTKYDALIKAASADRYESDYVEWRMKP